jgi:hypothetical protein
MGSQIGCRGLHALRRNCTPTDRVRTDVGFRAKRGTDKPVKDPTKRDNIIAGRPGRTDTVQMRTKPRNNAGTR